MANSTSLLDSSNLHTDATCLVPVFTFDPYGLHRLGTTSPPTLMMVATLNAIAAPPTVFLNALTIWTVLSDQEIRSTSFNVLLAALAGNDLSVGLLVQPLFAVTFYGCAMNGCNSPCMLTVFILVSMICNFLTAVTLMLACVERYLTIEHQNYLNHLTRNRVMTLTLVLWIIVLAILIGGAYLIKTRDTIGRIPPVFILVVCAVVTLYCSIKVQITAHQQRKTIDIQIQSVRNGQLQPEEQKQQEQEQRLKEYKQVMMASILVAMSALFYMPMVVSIIITTIIQDPDSTSDFEFIAVPIGGMFVNLQSLINPICMALRLSYIREGLKKKLSCFNCGN